MSNDNNQTPIGLININFLVASAGFWLAWVFWQLAIPGLEFIRLLSVICALGGIKSTSAALRLMWKLYAKERKIKSLKAQGSAPKEDPFANVADHNDWRPKS